MAGYSENCQAGRCMMTRKKHYNNKRDRKRHESSERGRKCRVKRVSRRREAQLCTGLTASCCNRDREGTKNKRRTSICINILLKAYLSPLTAESTTASAFCVVCEGGLMMAFWRAGSDCSRTNLITLRKRVLAGTSGLRASLLRRS